MAKHEFSIIASGVDPAADDFETRFLDAGCDDATVSFQKGYAILDFTRSAPSLEDALSSAIEQVRRAGARVERIEPDPLVSLADIAARTGLTRAAVSNYWRGHRGEGFPAPVARITSDSPLWDWATVAEWLRARGSTTRGVANAARVIGEANAAVGSRTARAPRGDDPSRRDIRP